MKNRGSLFFELLKDSIYNLYLQRKKIFLVLLGIAVSVCMIVVIFSIKNALEGAVREYISIKYMISRNIICRIEEPKNKEDDYGLTEQEIEELELQLADTCNYISYKSADKIKGKFNNLLVSMTGISSHYMESMEYELVSGCFFNAEDYENPYAGILISETVAESEFGNADKAIGNEILVFLEDRKVIRCYVVGVFKIPDISEKKVVQEKDFDVFCTNIFFNNLQDNKKYKYRDIFIRLNNMDDAEKYCDNIRSIIEKDFLANQYSVTTYYANVHKNAKRIINTLTLLLLIIIIIAFVVAGVSIMNVMLVSVRRRTNEIGIMKAIGCKNSWIQIQFVMESILIGICGDLLGLMIGFCFVQFMNNNWKELASCYISENILYELESEISFIPSFSMVIVSLIYCILTGVLFGHCPAKKAAEMEVVDALRFKA